MSRLEHSVFTTYHQLVKVSKTKYIMQAWDWGDRYRKKLSEKVRKGRGQIEIIISGRCEIRISRFKSFHKDSIKVTCFVTLDSGKTVSNWNEFDTSRIVGKTCQEPISQKGDSEKGEKAILLPVSLILYCLTIMVPSYYSTIFSLPFIFLSGV